MKTKGKETERRSGVTRISLSKVLVHCKRAGREYRQAIKEVEDKMPKNASWMKENGFWGMGVYKKRERDEDREHSKGHLM